MKSTADIYRAFKSGAGLRTEEVREMLAARGHEVSNNRLREFARSSDRGGIMTNDELHSLISEWAARQRRDMPDPA